MSTHTSDLHAAVRNAPNMGEALELIEAAHVAGLDFRDLLAIQAEHRYTYPMVTQVLR